MNTCNVTNRTIYCHDNLEILQGINSSCIDLIYLDPPFNKKKIFSAPIGTSAEGASFKDIFTKEDVKEEWLHTIESDHYSMYRLLEAVKDIEGRTSYNFCYLAYMAIRLIECHRVLKDSGSIYLHCDPTMSHYLKLLLDCIFGEKNFRNEIVWKRHSSGQKGSQFEPKKWGANTDHIFFYVKNNHTKLDPFVPFSNEEIQEKFKYKDENGEAYQIVPITRGKNKGNRPNLNYEFKGVHPPPAPNGWSLSKERMQEEYNKGNIVVTNNKLERRKYLKDSQGKSIGTGWNDIPPSAGKEKTGYPTQKPLALLERIIKASSNEGDVVLDPFCGCATTCVAAEKYKRQWIGIDILVKAYELVQTRIKDEVYEEGLLKSEDGNLPQIHFRINPPSRTSVDTTDTRYVYIMTNELLPGVYKVGISKNPEERAKSVLAQAPTPTTVVWKYSTHHDRDIEHYIHNKYPTQKEWVKGNIEEIKRDITTWEPEKKLFTH